MIEQKEIYQYQSTGTDGATPGKIYKKLAKQYGATGADAIATAARTGDEKAIFDAEAGLKPGGATVATVAKKPMLKWIVFAAGGLILIVLLIARRKKKS